MRTPLPTEKQICALQGGSRGKEQRSHLIYLGLNMGKGARIRKEKAAYRKMVENGVPAYLASSLVSEKLVLLDDDLNPIPFDSDAVIKSVKESIAGGLDTQKLRQAIAEAVIRLENQN